MQSRISKRTPLSALIAGLALTTGCGSALQAATVILNPNQNNSIYSENPMKRKFIIHFLVASFVAVVLSGCGDSKTGAQPSAMITDEATMQKFGSEALPKNYHVLSRATRWHVDGVQQHF